MAFGLTDAGFQRKRLEDIKTELEQQFAYEFGTVNTDPDGPIGQLIGVFSRNLADVWELMEDVYESQYPGSASGVPLDGVSELTGITRLAATNSEATLHVLGDEGTVLSAGRQVSVADTGDIFETIAAATITRTNAVKVVISVSTVLNATTYTVTISSTNYTYLSDANATAEEIAAGLVADINLGSQAVTATDNLDGTFSVSSDDYITGFNYSVDANLAIDERWAYVAAEAQETGPITALAGTLTVIETPVSGWTQVTNPIDATEGRNTETDAALRLRRAQSLQIAGAAVTEAIRARLQEVDGVTGVSVVENDGDVSDGDGRPPHSFECIVAGGDDQDIIDELWQVKPAGIQTYGNVSGTTTDSQGNIQTLYFSRATEIYLWVRITLTLNPEETFPTGGTQQVADNILALGETFDINDDVIVQKLFGPIYDVEGISSAVVEIATSATPAGPPGAYQTTNLAIGSTEVAVFDSSRIEVTVP